MTSTILVMDLRDINKNKKSHKALQVFVLCHKSNIYLVIKIIDQTELSAPSCHVRISTFLCFAVGQLEQVVTL